MTRPRRDNALYVVIERTARLRIASIAAPLQANLHSSLIHLSSLLMAIIWIIRNSSIKQFRQLGDADLN